MLYAQPGAPVHRRAARRDPGARSRRVRPDQTRLARRRAALAGRPAERLPVPHPLPDGRRSGAPTEEPQIREVGAGPLRRLPLPARSRASRSSSGRLWVAQADRGYPDPLSSLLTLGRSGGSGIPRSAFLAPQALGRSGGSGIPRSAFFAPDSGSLRRIGDTPIRFLRSGLGSLRRSRSSLP